MWLDSLTRAHAPFGSKTLENDSWHMLDLPAAPRKMRRLQPTPYPLQILATSTLGFKEFPLKHVKSGLNDPSCHARSSVGILFYYTIYRQS
jgi:hypothetical protein